MLISRSSRSQMFFKIGALKNFVIFTICAGPCRLSFTEHMRWLLLDFRGSKYIFSAESGIYCWQSHWFLLQTPLKTRVKPQKQPLELFCKKYVLRLGSHHCDNFHRSGFFWTDDFYLSDGNIRAIIFKNYRSILCDILER